MELSFASTGLFLVLISSQMVAISLLPRTAGFTDLYWTVACLGLYAISMWCLAYMIHAGMPLSLMIPILAALVPLVAIGIGVVFYKEAASVFKIVILCGACGMIGVASLIK
jgi:multidrug transporter EmrE-like cation transporter